MRSAFAGEHLPDTLLDSYLFRLLFHGDTWYSHGHGVFATIRIVEADLPYNFVLLTSFLLLLFYNYLLYILLV